jgi:hypothetical protein
MMLDELDVGEFRGYAAAAVRRALTTLLALPLSACGGLEAPLTDAVVRSILEDEVDGGWSTSSDTLPTSYPNLCLVMQPCDANPTLQCEVWVPCGTQDPSVGEGTPPTPVPTDDVASPN